MPVLGLAGGDVGSSYGDGGERFGEDGGADAELVLNPSLAGVVTVGVAYCAVTADLAEVGYLCVACATHVCDIWSFVLICLKKTRENNII